MYTIYVKFTCLPGKRESFIEKIKELGLLDAIRTEDGCHRYDFYFSEKDANELLLIEEWETKKHQQIHIDQPHMEVFREVKDTCVADAVLGEFSFK